MTVKQHEREARRDEARQGEARREEARRDAARPGVKVHTRLRAGVWQDDWLAPI